MKRCRRQGCANTFGPGTKGGLARQQYCSPACGKSQINNRTREILRLTKLGKTPAAIAQSVNATPAWVRMVRA